MGASNFTSLQRNTTTQAGTATKFMGPFEIPQGLALTVSVASRAQVEDIKE
jgi:hypothetical protein